MPPLFGLLLALIIKAGVALPLLGVFHHIVVDIFFVEYLRMLACSSSCRR
jgi:hypothetical protein